jgi:hypothetical protein
LDTPLSYLGVLTPSQSTLEKYGLSLGDWSAIVERQGGVCRICGNLPSTKRLVIDHEHAPRYKKMPPNKRRECVRGLLCWLCNLHLVGRGVTIKKLRGAVEYLEEYEQRTAETF